MNARHGWAGMVIMAGVIGAGGAAEAGEPGASLASDSVELVGDDTADGFDFHRVLSMQYAPIRAASEWWPSASGERSFDASFYSALAFDLSGEPIDIMSNTWGALSTSGLGGDPIWSTGHIILEWAGN